MDIFSSLFIKKRGAAAIHCNLAIQRSNTVLSLQKIQYIGSRHIRGSITWRLDDVDKYSIDLVFTTSK